MMTDIETLKKIICVCVSFTADAFSDAYMKFSANPNIKPFSILVDIQKLAKENVIVYDSEYTHYKVNKEMLLDFENSLQNSEACKLHDLWAKGFLNNIEYSDDDAAEAAFVSFLYHRLYYIENCQEKEAELIEKLKEDIIHYFQNIRKKEVKINPTIIYNCLKDLQDNVTVFDCNIIKEIESFIDSEIEDIENA